MFDFRVKTKVTFSFSKLNRKLATLLPQTMQRANVDIANKWRENIKSGDFTPLKPATMKRRKYKNYNNFYPRTKPRNTTKPLIATGNLLKSIKTTDKGISFNHYGDWHVKGMIRPRRNWQTLKGLGKGAERLLSDNIVAKLKEEIRKGFRLAGRGKNIRDIRL